MTPSEMFALIAKPAFVAMPAIAQALIYDTMREATSLRPKLTLDAVPWPNENLRLRFQTTPSALLAGMALTMARYTLWNPDKEWLDKYQAGPMNFVSLADQSLRVRNGLSEAMRLYDDQQGLQLWISEGLVRVEADVRYRHGWFACVGLATESTFQFCLSQPWPKHPGHQEHPDDIGRWSQAARGLTQRLCAARRVRRGTLAPFFDAGLIVGHPAKVKEEEHGSAQSANRPQESSARQRGLFS